ncbi:hypothetical protein PACILC2_28090 [Paenibacillus cisolokensis]|uniref:Acetolactate synthase n=1 Tax=Paenibacillus cisolokensis TaxID=1658519 RepID=A0ABQ4N7V7_9BACL|nr:thiamine pyrophosphate-binding protein [Paenibacillus cisolokensis]GIQ64241.1 hypothetical protein PACILC2_28090 [Paenibacillus cisolokensis]
MESVAAVLAKHFQSWAVTHVFGVPGKAILPIINACDRVGIRFVLSSHEGAAGFEASGFAWGKETLGVCLGTSGPGGTNLVTSAAQAKASNLPVLFITGHPSMKDTGAGLGQDASYFGTDIVKILEPVTKFSMRVERGDLLKTYLRHAMERAFSGVRGPVHLSIPYDVFQEQIEPFELELPSFSPTCSLNLGHVAELIERARRPVIFAGKGVHSARAYDELRRLAERWSIPVMTTASAKGAFPTLHPLSLGGFGLGGTDKADRYLLEGTDLLLVIGTKLSDMTLSGYREEMKPERIVHFDFEPTFIGKTIDCPTVPVLGDIKANLAELLRLSGRMSGGQPEMEAVRVSREAAAAAEAPVQDGTPVLDETSPQNGTPVLAEAPVQNGMPVLAEASGAVPSGPSAIAAAPSAGDGRPERPDRGGFISSGDAIRAMQRHMPQDALLFGDCGSHTFYAIRDYVVHTPGTFIFDSLFGAMGHAIGYAVGAKLARPEQTVVCLTGDGCMLMHGTEVSTAVNYDVPVIFVVLNNGRLDMVEKGMTKYLGKAIGAIYKQPIDAAAFGESLGALGFRCLTEEDIGHAMRAALASGRTAVLDIIVDPLETPPTMKR